MFCTTSVLEKCLQPNSCSSIKKVSWIRDTFPKPKSCKTLFLTTKAFRSPNFINKGFENFDFESASFPVGYHYNFGRSVYNIYFFTIYIYWKNDGLYLMDRYVVSSNLHIGSKSMKYMKHLKIFLFIKIWSVV